MACEACPRFHVRYFFPKLFSFLDQARRTKNYTSCKTLIYCLFNAILVQELEELDKFSDTCISMLFDLLRANQIDKNDPGLDLNTTRFSIFSPANDGKKKRFYQNAPRLY